MTGLYSVSWPDHASDRNSSIKVMLEKQSFVDVTIACDDDQVDAHKVLISAASPFFQKILERNPHAHPLLYLKGTLKKDVSAVLDFIYSGETSVPVNDFESFMALAKDLEVKGLVDDSEVSTGHEELPSEGNNEGTNVIEKKVEKQKRTRSRQTSQNTSYKAEQNKTPVKKKTISESADDFEQVKLKEEPEDNLDMDVEEEVTMDQFLEQDMSQSQNNEPIESIEDGIKMESEKVSEKVEQVKKKKRSSKLKSNGGDLVKSNDYEIADNVLNSDNLQENSSTNETTGSSTIDLHARIEALLVTTADGFFVCNECRYGSKNEAHVREHIEMHIDGVAHKCKTCSRVFTKKMSLRFHETKCQNK